MIIAVLLNRLFIQGNLRLGQVKGGECIFPRDIIIIVEK